ncbi:solute carrier organic anion transporter family member 74D-like [Stegodyphus dumicola]|uniref:solute carrier organic anion transporter family member 74D-like n=1 Tax=Stegodyphus dumicola TaxID=202533 RepID=UPI0015AEC15D|nr:solute carrier organic anion transporter family member 74D-like [Stegodyphus dumicola]
MDVIEPLSNSEEAAKSEDTKNTLCGICNYTPNWLQRFATSKCYLLFYSLTGVLQGAYVTYFIGILSTLEKRFSFDSQVTGIIMIADNLSPIFFSVLSYYAKDVHQPLLIAFGMMLSVISCIVSCLPYFFFGSEVTLSHNAFVKKIQLCNENLGHENCNYAVESQNNFAIIILFIANFLNGFASMTYYTFGIVYLDDNVKKKDSPLYIGTTYAMKIFGPTLGFMLSSFTLQYYENPFIDPGFDNRDSRWIGAWWTGFLFLAVSLFLVSFPIAFFPKQLRRKAASDAETVSSKKSVSDLLLSLKNMVKNPILVFHTLSLVFQINGIFGYFLFMPKYMESQFRKTASAASFFSGIIIMFGIVIGIFLGGICIRKFKPKPRFLTGYMLFVETFAGVVLFCALFMGCQSSISNKTVFETNLISQECNKHCSCNENTFDPICDINGTNYYSPCAAGCNSYKFKSKNNMIFNNCSCLHQSGNLSGETYGLSYAFCTKECIMFLPYVVLLSLSKVFSSTGKVGNMLIFLRSVDEKEKAFALATVQFVISIFATIPYPLIYGYVIDKTCFVWEEKCGHKGNCKLYDDNMFRYYFHSLAVCFILFATICSLVVFLLSKNMKDLYGISKSRKIPEENIVLNDDKAEPLTGS